MSADTRTCQWRATLDDLRTEMADMAEEGVASNFLEAARHSANVTLMYIAMLETELGKVQA